MSPHPGAEVLPNASPEGLPWLSGEGGSMITIEEAAKHLGLTPRQVYRRVSTVRPLLAPYIRRGRNGLLLLDGSAIEILRRAEELRKAGLTVAEAVARITEEMGENGGGELGRSTGKQSESGPWELLLREKDARIEELQAQVGRLIEENAWLRERVEEFQRLALPKPKRKWWWPWRGSTQAV